MSKRSREVAVAAGAAIVTVLVLHRTGALSKVTK